MMDKNNLFVNVSFENVYDHSCSHYEDLLCKLFYNANVFYW